MLDSNKPILHDSQEHYLNNEIDEYDKNKTIGYRPFLKDIDIKSKLGRTYTFSSKREPFPNNNPDIMEEPKMHDFTRLGKQIKEWKAQRMKIVKDALFKTRFIEWQLKNNKQ